VKRLADQDCCDILLAGQPRKTGEVLTDAGSVKCFQTLGRKPQLVADG